MTACPACKGTGRRPKAARHLSLVTDPACAACSGSGKLVDVLLIADRPRTPPERPQLPHGVGCPCEECQTF